MYLATWTWRNEVKMPVIREQPEYGIDEVRRIAESVCGRAGKIEITPIVFGTVVRDKVTTRTHEFEDVAFLWDSER